MAVLSDHGVKVHLPKLVGCDKGVYDEHVTFGANPRHVATNVKLGLFPYGLVHKYVGAFFVSLAARPKHGLASTTVVPAVASATTTSTTNPPSHGPVAPPVTSTVPPAPQISTSTPTEIPRPSSSRSYTEPQPQFAGWVVGASQPSYTGVSGTFVVPEMSCPANGNEQTTPWVGIQNGSDLAQAGVALGCTSGTVEVQPWWEMYPASFNVISRWDDGQPAVVSAGDQVTVTVAAVGYGAGDCTISGGCWAIEMQDSTSGGQFVTYQAYTGPGDEAAWMVEDSLASEDVTLGHSAPVLFDKLLVNEGAVIDYSADYVMQQNGASVGVPSALTNGSFSVVCD